MVSKSCASHIYFQERLPEIKVCTFFVDRKKSASKIPQAHGHLILFKTKKLSSLSKTEKDLFNVMTQHWLNSKAKAE